MSSLVVATVAIDPNAKDSGSAKEWLIDTLHSKIDQINLVIAEIDESYNQTGKEVDRLVQYASYISTHFIAGDSESEKKTLNHMEKFSLQAIEIKIRENEMFLESLEAKTHYRSLLLEIEKFKEKIRTDGMVGPENRILWAIKQKVTDIEREKSFLKKSMELSTFFEELQEQYDLLQSRKASQERLISSILINLKRYPPLKSSDSEEKTWITLRKKLQDIQNTRDLEVRDTELSTLEHACNQYLSSRGINEPVYIPPDNVNKKVNRGGEGGIKPKKKRSVKEKEILLESARVLDRIAFLDPDLRQEKELLAVQIQNEESVERLMLLRNHLKLEYGMLKERAALEKVIREELLGMRDDLVGDADAQPIIDAIENSYEEQTSDLRMISILQRQYYSYLMKKFSHGDRRHLINQAAGEIIRVLQKHGYEVTSNSYNINKSTDALLNQHDLTLNRREEMYGVMLSLNTFNEFVFRFVRTKERIDTPRFPSEQRLRDLISAREWCNDFESIKKRLGKDGYLIEEKIRKDPDDMEIPFITGTDGHDNR